MWEELPGWQSDIAGCRSVDELPANARAYVERMSDLAGVVGDAAWPHGVLWEVCVVRWCWWGSLCCGEGGSWAMWWASLRFGYQLVVNDSIE